MNFVCYRTRRPTFPKQDQDPERDQDQSQGWPRRSVGDGADGATRFHAASIVGSRGCGNAAPGLLASAAHGFAEAAHKAACCEPAFDALKIRFKLGEWRGRILH
jgi:hypothetical protein